MSKLTKPSEGFFLAKRRIQDGLANRIETLTKERNDLPHTSDNVDKHKSLTVKINTLEEARDYVRNGLLWDTSQGS